MSLGYDGVLTLPALLEWGSRNYPNQVITTFKGSHLTYREFDDYSLELAASLSRLGVRPGDHVAVLMANCPEWMALFFAIARLGATLVPVNVHFKTSELQYVLRQSDATVLITDADSPNRDYLSMLVELAPELSAVSDPELKLSALPELRRVIVRHEAAPPWATGWSDFVRVGRGHSFSDASLPERTVLIQYTSGSTAFPKGVIISQRQLIRDSQIQAKRLQFTPRDRYLMICPFFHGAGFLMGFFGPMTCGTSVVILERFEAEQALALIEQYRCTAVGGLDALYLMMLGHPRVRQYNLKSLERAWTSGNEIRRRLHEELGIPTVHGLYGLSEATANVMITEPWTGNEVYVAGYPHEGIEVEILAAETRQPLTAGDPGEICIRGWCVTAGYYKKPVETDQVFDDQGWLHTGDMGRRLPDGRFTYEGRIKDVIKVGGENVAAAEIEDVLLKHPGVKAAAVVAAPDPRLVEVPVAFVESRPGVTVTAEELTRFCRRDLTGLKVPRRFYFIHEVEWPMTGSGKLLKRELQARLPQLEGLVQ